MPAGTWNLGRIRKKAERQFLNDISTIEIRDTQSTSDRYFNIVEFPTTLTSGKNLFKIKASAETLVQDSTIYVEVVDQNGNAIYHEPINYLEQDGTRVIAIYIYPDTPYGTATVFVAGRAKKNADTGRSLRFSQDFNDPDYFQYPNVIWSRTVTCAPERYNTTEIIFTKEPELTVREIIQPYLEITNLQNFVTQSFGTGTYTITPQPAATTPPQTISQANTIFAPSLAVQGAFNRNTLPAYFGRGLANNSPAAASVGLTNQTGVSVNQTPNAAALAAANPNSSATTLAANNSQVAAPIAETPQAAPIIPVSNLSIFQTSEDFFLPDMGNGDVITIHNPLISVPQYTIGNTETPSKVLPAQQLVSAGLPPGGVLEVNNGGAQPNRNQDDSGLLSAGIHPLSGSYRLGIANVLSSKKALVYLIDGFRESAYIGGTTPGGWGVQVNKDVPEFLSVSEGGTLEDELPIIGNVQPTSNFTCSFTIPFITEATEQSQSFAEITLADIEPATGDVYKIRTFYKAGGQFGNFVDAGETILEQIEILTDSSSLEAGAADAAGFNRLGFFSNLADYDAYFTNSLDTTIHSHIPAPTNFITASFEVTDLMSGIRLKPNENYTDNDISYITLKDEYQPILSRDTEYLLSMNVFGNLSFTGSANSALPNEKPILDIWMSGSAGTLIPDPATRNANVIAAAFEQYEAGILDSGNFSDNGPFGTRIGTIIPNVSSSLTPAIFRFKSTENQQAKLFLMQRNGQFDIANMSIKTFNETGFSPNFTKITTRIPTQFIQTPLTFKFEFYDRDSTLAEYQPTIFPVFFLGENTVIGGENNLLSGSLFIGNAVGAGIELAGVRSGFIRTIGYEGFKSASRTDRPGGFLMWTGSVLDEAPDGYHGTGLEVVQDSGSFMRFSTGNEPGLEIRTPKFFLGSQDAGNFISGSGGLLEISSSKFHLQPDGDVILEGTITAEAGGDIGGWHIGTDLLSSSNGSVILDSDGPYHISASGFKVDATGQFTASAGNIAGLTIDETSINRPGLFAISSSTNESNNPGGFISSSNFKVNAGGVVTASAIQISGGTLENPGFYIIDNSTVTVNNPVGFISSSDFKVSAGGVVTASAGRIAGFTVDDESISFDDGNASFKISASSDSINHPASFISSSAFKVNAGGVITSSAGQIAGATISDYKIEFPGKWEISASSGVTNNPGSFISSSLFKVNAAGVVTASSIQLTGGTLDNSPYWKIDNSTDTTNDPTGFISSSAFKVSAAGEMTTSNADIAGWKIDANSLSVPDVLIFSASSTTSDPIGFISSSNFKVSPGGAFTSSNADIAGWKIDETSISLPNVVIISSSIDDNLPGGFISSSDFQVSPGGRITASKGIIAGWQIDDKRIFNTNIHLSASYGMKIFSAEDTDFVEIKYIADDNYGLMAMSSSNSTFALGNNILAGVPNNHIAGWEFDNQQIKGGKLILDKSGKIFSEGFQSSAVPLGGTGFLLTVDDGTGASFLEVENARIRGTLSTAVFEKETVNAVGGQLIVANSTTLTGSAIAPAGFYSESMQTMSVANVTGFSEGEILFAKKVGDTGFNTEYLLVESSSRSNMSSDNDFTGEIFVQRGFGVSNQQPSGGLPGAVGGAVGYSGSQVLVSTGKINTGFIHLNANPNDVFTPYIDIVERTGSGLYDAVKVARLGDLSGIEDTSFSDDVKGFGLYTQNGYFKGKIEVASQPTLPTGVGSIHYNFMAGTGSIILNQMHAGGTGSLVTDDPDCWASGSNAITGDSALRFNEGKETFIGISDVFIADPAPHNIGLKDASDTAIPHVSGSIASWFKVDNVTHGDPQIIFEAGASNGGINLYVSESRLWGTAYEGGVGTIITSASIDSNRWYHSAFTFNAGTGSLYINGTKQTTHIGPATSTVLNGFGGLQGVGAHFSTTRITHTVGDAGTNITGNGTGTFLTGSIDELRIYYHKLLTDNEIAGLYLTPQGPVPGATIIEGGRIQTGLIQSSNLSTSEGSEFSLDDGTFKLGGTGGPKFAWDGTQLRVTGSILISAGATYDAINAATGSVAAINTATASQAAAINTINATTASLNAASASFNSVTGSFNTATGSLIVATTALGAVTASLNSVTGSLNSATASLSNFQTSLSASFALTSASAAGHATQSYAFGGDAFTLGIDGVTPGDGLNLNADFMGYYEGGQFTTYISSSGNFFLGGTDGTFQWNNATATLGISGSNVDIRTPKFFLGGPLQYISGSDENIEISSSNFHLTAEGNVTASGIRLRGGEIINEHYWKISTDTDLTNNPVGFISSSNFKVSTAGEITASAIQLTGGTLENPGFYKIDNSTTVTNNPVGFISSSNFKVSSDGAMTASGANITGDVTITSGPLLASISDFPSDEFLVAYYPLHQEVISADGHNMTLDFSGNDRHSNNSAVGINSSPDFVSGSRPVAGALDFDGSDDYVRIDSIAGAFSQSSDVSVSWWQYHEGGGDEMPWMLSDGGENTLTFVLNDGGNNNRIEFIVNHISQGTIDVGTTLYEFTNQWHHMCVTVENGNTSKLYMDGEHIGNFDAAVPDGTKFDTIDEAFIGADIDSAGGAPDNFYEGELSELRFYNTLLSHDNVRALYNNPGGKPTTTKISGDRITAGSIQSTNWTSDAGSQIDLNAGTIKMGGITAPKFVVSQKGAVTASAGKIGGWGINANHLLFGATGGGIWMGESNADSGQTEIRISSDGLGTGGSNYVRMYIDNDADTWGIEGRTSIGTSGTVFHLGETAGVDDNQIAGISFDTGKLHVGTTYHISASTTVSDPIGFISSSAFKVSPGGVVTASGALIDGDSQFAGTISVGAATRRTSDISASLMSYESSYANASNANYLYASASYYVVDNLGATVAASTGSGYEVFIFDHRNWGTEHKNDEMLELWNAGYSVLSIGNDTTSAQEMIVSTDSITNTGAAGKWASEPNPNLNPADPLGQGWSAFDGEIDSGNGVLSVTPETQIIARHQATADNPGAPSVFYIANNKGGKWVHSQNGYLYAHAPELLEKIMNFLTQRTQEELAYRGSKGTTTIDGNLITTGRITSEVTSHNTGSLLDLEHGTLNLGGTGSLSRFRVDPAGLVFASNFTEKYIQVTDAVSGSYLRSISGTTQYNLVFDGTLGGEVTMNMEIATTAGFEIMGLELPATGSDKAGANVFISTGGVFYDDGNVSSGFVELIAEAEYAQEVKSTCFPIGTRILMSDGTWKSIENIQIGDLVRTKEGTNVPVLDSFIWNANDTIPMYTNGELTVTDGHPLWIDGKWQTADKLGWDNELTYVDNLYYLQTENNYIVEGIPATGILNQDHPGKSIKNNKENK